MTVDQARKWLAIYFLLVTVVTGAFLLLFNGTSVLPLSSEDASACFQIIIPVLVGQVTVIFQWIAIANKDDPTGKLESPVPSWAIRLPATLAVLIVVAATVVLAIANRPSLNWTVSPSTFKSAVTFAVTILNASTVFLVARFFPSSSK
jgi:hypothetical protein